MALSCALITFLLFAPQQDPLTAGMAQLDANQPAAAEPLFRQAVQADNKDFSAHFNLALALSLQQKEARLSRSCARPWNSSPVFIRLTRIWVLSC